MAWMTLWPAALLEESREEVYEDGRERNEESLGKHLEQNTPEPSRSSCSLPLSFYLSCSLSPGLREPFYVK